MHADPCLAPTIARAVVALVVTTIVTARAFVVLTLGTFTRFAIARPFRLRG